MSSRFNPPPNWPAPPDGWTPPPGWQPDPAWGPAPVGWQLWLDDDTKAKRSWFLRHKILTGLGALVLVGAVGGALGGGNDPTTPTSDTAAAAHTPAPTTTSSTTTTTPATPTTSTSSTTTTAAAVKTTKAAPPPKPKPFKAMTARDFAKMIKNPDAYKGRRVIIYAEVFQFDAATGDAMFLANVGNTKKKPEYGYVDFSDTALFVGVASKLDDVVEGDLLTINATVMGSLSYDTQIGGNTTVPQLAISSLKRYGSTKS